MMVRIASALVSLILLGILGGAAWGQAFPARPIQLVVPFPPGASTDLLARFIAPKLSEALGQPVVVENRAGAGGLIGASYVAKAQPDGHILLVASSTVMQGPLLQKSPAFDVTRDFAPIAAAFKHPFLMVSSAMLPAQTISEFIAYAKTKPGALNAASLGGFSDVISSMFMHTAGLNIQVVPYRGGAEAMIGVIRGDAHLVFNPYSAMRSQIASGQVRMMAVTSLTRSQAIPNVPTLAESGLQNFEIINVVGLLAPAGTPKAVVSRLNQEVARIMSSPEGKAFVADQGNDLIEDVSSAFYESSLAAANEKYRNVIETIAFPKQ